MIQGPYCYSKSNQSSPILFYTTRGWNRGRKATWNYYTLNLKRKVVKRKMNRMWNGILQSTTTFPSAGGGVIEQMCQDFCRKRKKYVDKHKRKVHFSEGYLEKEGVEKDSYMPLKLSQSVPGILPTHGFHFGTRYKVSEESIRTYIIFIRVSTLFTKQKNNLIPIILRSFHLWSWCMIHSLYNDCRFLFSPVYVRKPTRFYGLW